MPMPGWTRIRRNSTPLVVGNGSSKRCPGSPPRRQRVPRKRRMPWPPPLAGPWLESDPFDGQGPLALSLHSEGDGNDVSERNRTLEIDATRGVHVQKAAPWNDEDPASWD